MHIPTRSLFATAALLLGLACQAQVVPPQSRPCPAEVPAGAGCYTGLDDLGAFYWIAVPANWDRQVLVMHAHGGPSDTGPARLQRSEEDLRRWAVTVKAGYAWAGSTYRRGGYGVTMAAQDTERLRRIFVAQFGQPRRTLLHGQSYGGGVASKAAELYATVDGRRGPYDGVLLTSGMLGGGTAKVSLSRRDWRRHRDRHTNRAGVMGCRATVPDQHLWLHHHTATRKV